MKSSSLFKACLVYLSTESLIPIEIAYKGKNAKEYPSIAIRSCKKDYSIEYLDIASDGTLLIKKNHIDSSGCLKLDYL